MDDDMWTVSSSGSSISYRSAIASKYQSGSANLDNNGDFEEVDQDEEEHDDEDEDEDEDIAGDYPCPFCSDDYELVELIHHISEEHQLEENNGICPVCSKRVRMHMVDHITTQHRDVLKKQTSYIEQDPYSSDTYHQSLLDELPSSLNHHHHHHHISKRQDHFLSFINNSSLQDQTKKLVKANDSSAEEEKKLRKDDRTEKERKLMSPLSDSEQLEKANKCEYVHGLLLSAMFHHDGL